MKTARRHELHHNQLADWLGEKIEEVTPYSRAIVAGVIAILALVAVTVIWNRRSHAQEEAAWNDYFAAFSHARDPGFGRDSRMRPVREDLIEDLRNVATKYPGRAGGIWARLTLGNMRLDAGIDNLFKDRETSKEELEDATKNFEMAFSASSDPAVREQATLGLARTYEAEGNLTEARKNYEKMVKNWPNGIYTDEAKQRIEDLSQKPTEQFYAWFEKLERKPDTSKPFRDPMFPPGHPPIKNPSFQPLDGSSFSIPRDAPVTGDVPAADGKKPAEEKKADDKPAEDKKGEEKKPAETKPDDKKSAEKEPAKEQGDEKAKEPEKK